MQEIKNFIYRLQNSDEATKKRWLFGATAVVMILVIALWSICISFEVKNVGANETSQTNNPSFFAVFSTGLNMLDKETKQQIKELINQTKSFMSFKKDFDFTLNTLEKIEPKLLP